MKKNVIIGGFFNIKKITSLVNIITEKGQNGFIVIDERGDSAFSEQLVNNNPSLNIINLHNSNFFDFESLKKDIDNINFETIINSNQKFTLMLPPLKVSICIINQLKQLIAEKLFSVLENYDKKENFLIFINKSNLQNNDNDLIVEFTNMYENILKLNCDNLELYFSFDDLGLNLFKEFRIQFSKDSDIVLNIIEYVDKQNKFRLIKRIYNAFRKWILFFLEK